MTFRQLVKIFNRKKTKLTQQNKKRKLKHGKKNA